VEVYFDRLGSVPWEAWNCTLGGLEVYFEGLGSVPWEAWKCTLGGLEMYLGVHLRGLEMYLVRLGQILANRV
jgi:hypothetical protein